MLNFILQNYFQNRFKKGMWFTEQSEQWFWCQLGLFFCISKSGQKFFFVKTAIMPFSTKDIFGTISTNVDATHNDVTIAGLSLGRETIAATMFTFLIWRKARNCVFCPCQNFLSNKNICSIALVLLNFYIFQILTQALDKAQIDQTLG